MKKTIIITALLWLVTLGIHAQSQSLYDPVIDKVVNSYSPWTAVEFSGKVKSPKLPMTLTAKLFMVRDSLIQLSLRAPLVGEVARANITNDEITLIYKLKRFYAQEPTQKLLEIYPGLLRDIQSLLLARVVVLGQGELSWDNADIVGVEEDREGGYLLLPDTSEALLNYNYGYLIDGASRTRALIATLPGNISLELLYDYQNRGLQIDVDFRQKSKQTTAEIDFSSVKWGGSPMSPLRLVSYKRVGIKEFFKSF